MADTTFGVKVPEELKEQLQKLISDSGLTGKDFMQSIVNLYQVEKTKESMPVVAEDLKELQTLTQRINNIYINLGYRIDNIIQAKDTEIGVQLQARENIIMDLQAKNEAMKEEVERISTSHDVIVNINNDLNIRVNQLTDSNDNIKALNEEYKNKIDTLSGIVSEYKQYKEDVEEYKKLLADSQSRNIILENKIKEKDFNINNLNEELQSAKNSNKEAVQTLVDKHNEKIDAMKEKIELEKQKAILELQLKYQSEIEELNGKHNKIVGGYQAKYKELLENLEQIRNLNIRGSATKIGTSKKE